MDGNVTGDVDPAHLLYQLRFRLGTVTMGPISIFILYWHCLCVAAQIIICLSDTTVEPTVAQCRRPISTTGPSITVVNEVTDPSVLLLILRHQASIRAKRFVPMDHKSGQVFSYVHKLRTLFGCCHGNRLFLRSCADILLSNIEAHDQV